MTRQPKCQGCGQLILGAFITAMDGAWHAEHFCCAVCKRPIGSASFYQHEGQPYHVECYHQWIAPKCVYCGQPLTGQYLVDHWGAKFCADHCGQYPSCRFCGRLVPPNHQERGAGSGEGVRCLICRSRAIEHIAQARPIFARLVKWINGQGLLYNNLDLRIELRNRKQLAQFMSEPGDTQCLGAALHTTFTENGRVVRSQVNGVAILRGLPITLFQGVTVHELGHAWLAVHCVADLPQWANEGFCELLAHRFYTQMNTVESRFHTTSIEKNPDPAYGEGFRRMRDLANKTTFASLIEILRVKKRLPTSR